MQLTLEGVSTASWKEFATEWKTTWRDGAGRTVATAATNLIVRAEGAPASFIVQLAVPATVGGPPATTASVEGKVQRMTGMYHGHGVWMHLKQEDEK